MSIEVKERPTAAEPAVVITNRGVDVEMIKAFKSELDAATSTAVKHAVDQGMTYANTLAMTLIDAVETKIKGIEKPVEKILFVSVNDVERKLSKPASPILPQLLRNALLGHPTYIKGPAGSGKTTAASQVAEGLGASFYRQVMAQDMGLTMLWGRQVGERFVDGAIMQGVRDAQKNPDKSVVVFIDEMDAANDNCLLSLNAFFEKPGQAKVYNPITGESFLLPKNLIVVAAGNTWGKGADHVYTGRSRLDGASMRRFVKLELDYSKEVERAVVESIYKSVNRTPEFSFLEKLWKAREQLKKIACDEIISTGCIEMLHEQLVIGQANEKEVIKHFTMPWSDGIAATVGLTA